MEWKNAPRQLPAPATAGKASEALAAAAFCAADGVKVLAGGTVMTPAANSMPSCAIARCKRFKVSRCTTLGLLRQHRQFEPHHQRVVGDLGHALKLEKWSSCPTCGTASTIFAAGFEIQTTAHLPHMSRPTRLMSPLTRVAASAVNACANCGPLATSSSQISSMRPSHGLRLPVNTPAGFSGCCCAPRPSTQIRHRICAPTRRRVA